MTAIFLDMLFRPSQNRKISGSVRCGFYRVNYIKTSFHYFFELARILQPGGGRRFTKWHRLDIKFSLLTPITQ
ncbi:hypothetical protein EGM70_17875 [Enterobacteriaceae bacterium 89]|nr:hypothetical protein [Enterobacteriaceae bacterium 89]